MIKKRFLSILALLLSLVVGEVQAQKSLPSKHGFEQNRMSANARETFGQNRKSANAREVQSATTAQTPSRRSVLRAPSTDVLAPTDVKARGITGASATVSWNGTGDSYNLRYRKYFRTIIFSEGFESCSHGELPAGWTALDADGDGHSWFAYDYSGKLYDDNGNPNAFDRMCIESESYHDRALTPDNWLISPQVPLEGKLSLWAKGVDPAWAAEHFAIYLSTTGKDVADFTTVLIPETVAQDVLTEYTADLSAYTGQVGYIAIRHFNVTDMYQLAVDNITITDGWVEVDGVTSPYTLDGLDDHSLYEVEVQAVTGEQQSSWSSTLRFYTLRNATILYHQNFDDTNDINELGWTFVDNDGNGRNWTMSINGKYDDREVPPSATSTSVPNSLYSQSYISNLQSAINADNWAITPAIKIYESTILSFQLAYADHNYPDKVSVYVGETANVNEMTEVLAPTSFSRTANLQFNEVTVDLSAFAGKTCYIAFWHQDYDKWIVLIDDVIVYTTAPKYDLTLADGTEDAANWQGKADEGKYQALPLEGVFAGTAVSVKYNGTKHVKSVKAVKKAAAYAANEYNEASWDGTKVTFTKQTAASVTAVANSDAAVTWGDGWYTVSGDVTITGNVTLTADAHLILQDGAKLTINGQLNCRTNGKNLYIYGQKNGDGKLNVTNNGAHAINSHTNYRIDIHGGEVTAAATGNNGNGLNTGYLAVYGGKLTATSGSRSGINFQNTFNVYGGEVEATSNATSDAGYGISSGGGTSSQILTVYGGKVTATGNGIEESPDYGSGFRCYVKSGTSGIKFYFSEDGTTWDEGTSYASATDLYTIHKRYAKAE